MKPKISVIIPNWNGKKYLKTCLDSLKNQSFKNFEIILVDNGSRDESIEFVKSCYPEIQIISLWENTGFSKAVNTGIKKAKGEYILLLNNDTEADPNLLKNLNSALKKYHDYYFYACKILCFDKRDTIDSAGDGLYINGIAYRKGHHQKDKLEFNEIKEVFGACGAAALYRKKLFSKIGFFDEDFFAFYEDVDINFRAQLAGFRCLYIPSAIVYHIGHGTLKVENLFVQRLSLRNRFFVLIKNAPLKLFLRYFREIIWFHLWWIIKDLVKILAKYKYNEEVKFRFRVRNEILKNFWRLYRKRRIIQKNRKINLGYLESILTPSPKF